MNGFRRCSALPVGLGAREPARVDAVGRLGVSSGGGHRLVALPERQRAQAGVGGDEVQRCVVPERGRPTTMIGRVTGSVADLGVAGEEIVDAQAVRGVTHTVRGDARPTGTVRFGSWSTSSSQSRSRSRKSSGPKSSRPVRVTRRVEDGVLREVDRFARGALEQGLLGGRELRVTEVRDPDRLRHQPAFGAGPVPEGRAARKVTGSSAIGRVGIAWRQCTLSEASS